MNPLLTRLGVVLLVAAAPVGVYLAPSQDRGPSYPKAWDTRVLEEVQFVESTRELKFEHPVTLSFLAEEAFVEKVGDAEEPTAEDKRDEKRALEMLRALGLVGGGVDLHAAVEDLRRSGIVGLYVSEEKTLYVRGTELTPYVRSTVVHELTHALQDQHFDLDGLFEKAPDGDDTALRGLIEGDAVRVEENFQSQLSPQDKQAYDAASQTAVARAEDADVPAVLQHLQEIPYVLGPGLLDVLLQQGGNAAVDRAFHTPPVSEAQLADPVHVPLDRRPVKVADPALPPGADELDEATPFGQMSLFQVLGAKLGYSRAWAAVQGWAGDRSRTYRQDGRTCVAVDVQMADAAAGGRVTAAARAWAAGNDRTVVEQEGTSLHLRACDPGSEAVAAPVEPDAFEVLAARAQLGHYLVVQQRVPPRFAECLSRVVVARLGDAGFAAANAGDGSPAQQQQVARAFEAAVRGCQG